MIQYTDTIEILQLKYNQCLSSTKVSSKVVQDLEYKKYQYEKKVIKLRKQAIEYQEDIIKTHKQIVQLKNENIKIQRDKIIDLTSIWVRSPDSKKKRNLIKVSDSMNEYNKLNMRLNRDLINVLNMKIDLPFDEKNEKLVLNLLTINAILSAINFEKKNMRYNQIKTRWLLDNINLFQSFKK